MAPVERLPIWLRAAFVAVRDGPRRAWVRRDVLDAFHAAGLLRAADPGGLPGREAADPGATPSPGREAPAPLPGRGGRGRVLVVPAGPAAEAVVRPGHRGGLPGHFAQRHYLLGDRAAEELVATEWARRRGAPVPEALAAVRAERRPGYLTAFVTRRVEGARPLAAALEAAGGGPAGGLEAQREAMRRAAGAVARLHAAGVWHADLNAHNVLLAPGGALVVDLDRARILPAPLPRLLAGRNLRRLRRSLRKLELGDPEAWEAFRAAYDRAHDGAYDRASAASSNWSS